MMFFFLADDDQKGVELSEEVFEILRQQSSLLPSSPSDRIIMSFERRIIETQEHPAAGHSPTLLRLVFCLGYGRATTSVR